MSNVSFADRLLWPADIPRKAGVVTAFISHTTIDCHDPYRLSEWWKVVLGYEDLPDDPNEPGDEECMIRDPLSDHRLLFVEVPGTELPAKRMHFDLRPRETAVGTRRWGGSSLMGQRRWPTCAATVGLARVGWCWRILKATSSAYCDP